MNNTGAYFFTHRFQCLLFRFDSLLDVAFQIYFVGIFIDLIFKIIEISNFLEFYFFFEFLKVRKWKNPVPKEKPLNWSWGMPLTTSVSVGVSVGSAFVKYLSKFSVNFPSFGLNGGCTSRRSNFSQSMGNKLTKKAWRWKS